MSSFKINLTGIGTMSMGRPRNEINFKKISGKINFFKDGFLTSEDSISSIKKDSLIWIVYFLKTKCNANENISSHLRPRKLPRLDFDSSRAIFITLAKVTKLNETEIYFDGFERHSVDESIVLNLLPYYFDCHSADNFITSSSDNILHENIFSKMEPKHEEIDILKGEISIENDNKDSPLPVECSTLQFEMTVDAITVDKSENIKTYNQAKTSLTNQKMKKKHYSCSECSESFNYKTDLHKHTKIHRVYHCSFCKETYSDRNTLKDHIKSMHALDKKSHSKDTPQKFACVICEKTFSQKSILTSHIRNVHATPQNFKCDICDKTIKLKTSLKQHMQLHSGEALRFQCSECGKMFSQKENLNTHIRHLHTKEKPYKCTYCSYAFAHISGFERHVRVHTGEKPYCCEICGRRFNRTYSLTEHLRRHRGIKLFTCKFCEKSFVDGKSLKKHTLVHH